MSSPKSRPWDKGVYMSSLGIFPGSSGGFKGNEKWKKKKELLLATNTSNWYIEAMRSLR